MFENIRENGGEIDVFLPFVVLWAFKSDLEIVRSNNGKEQSFLNVGSNFYNSLCIGWKHDQTDLASEPMFFPHSWNFCVKVIVFCWRKLQKKQCKFQKFAFSFSPPPNEKTEIVSNDNLTTPPITHHPSPPILAPCEPASLRWFVQGAYKWKIQWKTLVILALIVTRLCNATMKRSWNGLKLQSQPAD